MIPPKSGYIESKILRQDDYTRRYNSYSLYEDDNKNLFNETYINSTVPISDEDLYIEITASELYGWDLLAHKYYNNQLLGWKIMEANGIIDPFDMYVGMLIRIPVYTNLWK